LTDALLDIHGLTVDIPVGGGTLHAVRNIDLAVRRGETLCLVGESGCGKSLTALAIMDLLPARARRGAKRLVFRGEDLVATPRKQMNDLRGDRVAMIFQEPMTALNPCWTIGNQLEEVYLRHKGGGRRAARERAVFLLGKVGIPAAESRLEQYPHQLSGGLRQRVMIAMALMCGPDLVIADEPTTALDVTIQAQILLLLKELQREFEMGLLLITHDLGVVARVADRVAVMYAGQIVETGSAGALFGRPIHPYTRGLLGSVPVPGRTRRGEPLGSIPGIVPSLVGELTGCSFRDRCSFAMPECARDPAFVALETERGYRCLLPA
jgi:peptide/nickel transport system ATP-binding protein